ncbi:Gly-X carboxypeptidase [Coprinopsis cinerea okayama7|uniref:Gly-X carboxypeptidase n=1 Tax=Coprinopsis cinerea (strain Okayama-7 / 130 / ATCC MYA-4618 / FGSC 9003) TaxID=240176 RepID=A8N9I4_COPC7|nr:Gly-X carboxypeptidase [Coprinopsis cinerea okayama7\|eukprot:XP_001831490.2 Gly-X carboxypeptidase [Coprinopsis cinerea okayama7\
MVLYEKDGSRGLLLPSNAQLFNAEHEPVQPPKRGRTWWKFAVVAAVLVGSYCLAFGSHCSSHLNVITSALDRSTASMSDVCPQEPVLQPSRYADLWTELSKEISTDGDFREQAVNWLSGAVRIRTESFDGMGPIDEDPRWKAFEPFHEYLLGSFPLVHTTLKLTKVNTYGLLYEWVGSDTSLKPLLLAAHQDVVPVDDTTVHEWTHPPYSGHYDGTHALRSTAKANYPRSASVETLLKNGFKPRRTVVLAFGFDEEASGFYGAGTLAPFIKDLYGKDGIALIVDEGSGFTRDLGSWIASPGVAEKGYFNVKAEVRTPGGHSSVPPPHTSIGILAALLVHVEKNPVKAELTRDQPVYWTLQCMGAHAKEVPSDLRKAIARSAHSDKALKQLESVVLQNRVLESLVGTTQAIDLIQGGVKSNALPEQAWAVINHRITVTSSVAEVEERDTNLLKDLAREFNLTFTAFGSEVLSEADVAPSKGSLVLDDFANTALEPAPLTPTTGDEAGAYRLLSGTIKAAFSAWSRAATSNWDVARDEDIIVAPSMMTGNTDTRFYWDLSRHIFRYNHHNGKSNNSLGSGIHTVNEHIVVDTFLEMIVFFTTLILNTDESTSI